MPGSEILSARPFIKLFTALAAGIVLAYFYGPLPWWPWLLVAAALILFIIAWLSGIASYGTGGGFGILTSVLLVILGFALVQGKYRETEKNRSLFSGEVLLGDIVDMPLEKPKSYHLDIKLKAVKKNGEWEKASFRIIVYIEKDSLSAGLGAGDRLLIKRGIRDFDNFWEKADTGIVESTAVETDTGTVAVTRTENDFDYRSYMNDRGYYGQLYAPSYSWEEAEPPGRILSPLVLSSWIREVLFFKLSSLLKGDELAVSTALLLGDRDYLEEDIKESFSRAGVMHVMAVSGLHVGIIYLLLDMMFFFLVSSRGRKLKAGLIILLLWIYALVTGLSPSVMRATVMFSFLVAGRELERNTDIYNNLALSAFVLLLFDPFLLRNAGFQLSYIAVTGIVYLFEPVYSLLKPRNLITDRIWRLLVLSFVAQISVFPLVLYYFHQFPTLFLLNNLVVIPLVSLVLYLGFTAFLLSFWPWAFALLGSLLDLVARLMNAFIGFTGGLGISMIGPFEPGLVQLIIMYVVLVFVAVLVVSQLQSE